MISPRPAARAQLRSRFALGAVVAMLLNAPSAVDEQGRVQGVQRGAQAGNKAAGPVGGVVGGAIGGVVGVFTGVLGVGKNGQPPAASGTKQAGSAKAAKAAKGAKGTRQAMLTQQGQPQLTAQQIGGHNAQKIARRQKE